jgi:hypothetical protein
MSIQFLLIVPDFFTVDKEARNCVQDNEEVLS